MTEQSATTSSPSLQDDLDPIESVPAPTDDATLLRAYSERGDRQAMNALFARHADAAYRVALRCCRNGADAEDAVQTAFIEVLRHAGKFRGESAVKAWIFGFVVNACRHKAREEGRRAAREEKASVSGELPAEDRALQDAVRSAVRELPEHYRLPLWLHYCEGLSSPEVADALSLSENTVRSQLSRGVEELRMALGTAGLSIGVAAIAAVLGSTAVESAPASLTASISGLAAPAAKAGVAAKFGAAAMAAAAILSTAAALWSGNVPDDLRPPEFARIDEKVREWQPRPEERRFDEIGWAKSLTEGLRLAKESGRGIFVVAHVGHLNTGRTDGGSMSLRGGPLSDPRVIELLNTRYVPVYASTQDKKDLELKRVSRESLKSGFGAGTEHLYFLNSEGRVVDSHHICSIRTPGLIERLEKYATGTPGPALTPPAAQSTAPTTGARILHVTSRYLDRRGEVEKGQTSYHAFPAEEWMELAPADEAALVPQQEAPLNATWTVDLAVAARLLSRVYPLTANMVAPEKNLLQGAGLTATVVAGRRDTAWIRLDGRVAMNHPFFEGKESREVESAVKGYLEYDRTAKKIRTLRFITDGAVYGKENFAVAVRSVP